MSNIAMTANQHGGAKQAWKRLEILEMPLEVRELIYTELFNFYDAEDLENSAGEPNEDPFCMPLHKAHPHPVLEVCQQIRNEYIAHYFRNRWF